MEKAKSWKTILYRLVLFACCVVIIPIYIKILSFDIRNRYLLPGFFLLLMACFFLEKTGFIERNTKSILCVMVTIQVFLTYLLRVDLISWDPGIVVKNARNLALSMPFDKMYFARYPNNTAILLLYTAVFKVSSFLFHSMSDYFLLALNILAVDIGVFYIIKTAGVISPQAKHFTVLFVFLFSPFYLYLPICYTDTLSIPFASSTLYCMLRIIKNWGTFSKKDKVIRCLFLGFILFLGYEIKGSLIILMIAAYFILFFRFPFRRFMFVGGSVLCSFTVALILWNSCVNSLNLITQEEYEHWQFPYTHWIMMGIHGAGNYRTEDVYFSSSFDTYEGKKTATTEVIVEELRRIGVKGFVQRCFTKATTYTWNFGTCYAERFLGDYGDPPHLPNALHKIVLTEGTYHWLLRAVTQTIWLFFFLLTSINAIGEFRQYAPDHFLFTVTLTGAMCFFMIWEIHPRLTLNFTPLVLLSGSVAMAQLYTACTNLPVLPRVLRKKE